MIAIVCVVGLNLYVGILGATDSLGCAHRLMSNHSVMSVVTILPGRVIIWGIKQNRVITFTSNYNIIQSICTLVAGVLGGNYVCVIRLSTICLLYLALWQRCIQLNKVYCHTEIKLYVTYCNTSAIEWPFCAKFSGILECIEKMYYLLIEYCDSWMFG